MESKTPSVSAFHFNGVRSIARFALAGAILAILAACGGVKTDVQAAKERARTYVASHPSLDDKTKDAILRNTIRVGMTKEQVLAAWGRPIEVNKFKREEEWKFGCEYPHTCTRDDSRGGSRLFDRVRYESQVIFENGRVTSFRF